MAFLKPQSLREHVCWGVGAPLAAQRSICPETWARLGTASPGQGCSLYHNPAPISSNIPENPAPPRHASPGAGVFPVCLFAQSSGRAREERGGADVGTCPTPSLALAHVVQGGGQGPSCCSCLLRAQGACRYLGLETQSGVGIWPNMGVTRSPGQRLCPCPSLCVQRRNQSERVSHQHPPPSQAHWSAPPPDAPHKAHHPSPALGPFSMDQKHPPSRTCPGQVWQPASQFLWPQHQAGCLEHGRCCTKSSLMTDAPRPALMSLSINQQGTGAPAPCPPWGCHR